MTANSKLLTVQALRGLAALAVVLLHLIGTQVQGGIVPKPGVSQHGWMGVDLFFVISGFIMVWVTREVKPGAQTAGKFMLMRAARIYPLWWACTIIIAILYLVIHGVPASINAVPADESWGHLFLSLFLIPHQYAPGIGVGWSLIHELYFYIIFTLIILFGLRSRLWIALSLWAAVTVGGLYLGWGKLGPQMKIIISPYTLHFIAGAVAGLLLLRQDKARFGLPALTAGVVILGVIIAIGLVDKPLRVWQLTLPLTLIVYGAVASEMAGKLRSPKILTWLGDISYSLYLTHWLVLLAWQIAEPIYPGGMAYGLVSGLPGPALIALDFTILIIGCLVTAQIFYVLIEKPSLKLLRRHLPGYRAKKT